MRSVKMRASCHSGFLLGVCNTVINRRQQGHGAFKRKLQGSMARRDSLSHEEKSEHLAVEKNS